MRSVFRVFWEAAKDYWGELLMLALMNIVTMLLLFPVITFPPALAGLWNVGNLVAKGEGIHWSDYFGGFRRHFLRAWGLALINILAVAIVLTNYSFYIPSNAPFHVSAELSVWIRGFFVVLGILWLLFQIYPLAMLFELKEPQLRLALRNSAVLLVANPGFTVVLALLLLVVMVISTLLLPPLWFLATLAFLAVVCNKAVHHLLKPYRERLKAEQEGQEEPSEEEEAEEEEAEEEEAEE